MYTSIDFTETMSNDRFVKWADEVGEPLVHVKEFSVEDFVMPAIGIATTQQPLSAWLYVLILLIAFLSIALLVTNRIYFLQSRR